MNWKELYKQKLVTAEEAISHINDGDKVVTSFGCGEPYGIERIMYENYKKFRNVQINNMVTIGDSYWIDEKLKGHFSLNSFFATSVNRRAISGGAADFTTCHFYEQPMVIREIVKPRVSIVSVCPPDENGYVSLGTNVDYIESTLDYCEVKIAQVNKYVPRTYGKAIKHISDFDYLVEMNEPLPEVPLRPSQP